MLVVRVRLASSAQFPCLNAVDNPGDAERHVRDGCPAAKVLGQVADFYRLRPGIGLMPSAVAVRLAQASQFGCTVVAAHASALSQAGPATSGVALPR